MPVSQSDLDTLLGSFMRLLEENDDGDEALDHPVGRAKSVVFTEDGLKAALRSHRLVFAKTPPKSD